MGLLDFLGQQQGGGLLGGYGAPQQQPGLLGAIGGNQNAILGYLAGALQGGNLGQSIGRGLQGWMSGGERDRTLADQRNARSAALDYVGRATDIAAELRSALKQDPALAVEYVKGMTKSPEFKSARGIFGSYTPSGGLRPQGGISEDGAPPRGPVGMPRATPLGPAPRAAPPRHAPHAMSSGMVTPPAFALQLLESNPAAYATLFDSVYGPGSAARALGMLR